jgi:hypothetical protein
MPTAMEFSLQRSANRLYALREESILRIRLNQRVCNVKQQQGLRRFNIESHRQNSESVSVNDLMEAKNHESSAPYLLA